MRNATIQDVEEAQRSGALKEDVMYEYMGVKVHGKKVSHALASFIKCTSGFIYTVIAETAKGTITDVNLGHIKPLPKGGSAFTPRKPRPKPIKGTRPERKIPVDVGTKINIGDLVLLKHGQRVRITDQRRDSFVVLREDGTRLYEVEKSYINCVILPYEEKEVTYQIGDRFDSDVYGPQILAHVETGKVSLISLQDGNRFDDPTVVEDVAHITQQEFDMISHGVKFTKQSDSVK